MASKVDLDASEDHIRQLADLFALLGDVTRLRIVLTCLRKPTNVGDIADALDLSPSLVSHHLRLLRGARLLGARRQGRHMFYEPLDRHVECVIDDMMEHVAEPVRS